MLVAFDLDGTLDAYPRPLQSMMCALQASGHQVYVLTGMTSDEQPTPDDIAAKVTLLESLGVTDCYDKIIVVSSPDGDVSDAKARYLESVGADILIDNDKSNAKAVTAQGILALVPWGTREK